MTTAERPGDGVDTAPILHLTRTFEASRERVFAAFTETEALARWWGPGGFSLPAAELDLRPGGAYHFEMQAPDGDIVHLSGTFREVRPPERLVYTWRWGLGEDAGAETLVTLEFEERGETTELVLTHEMFPDARARDLHGEGWASSLDCLHADIEEGNRP